MSGRVQKIGTITSVSYFLEAKGYSLLKISPSNSLSCIMSMLVSVFLLILLFVDGLDEGIASKEKSLAPTTRVSASG